MEWLSRKITDIYPVSIKGKQAKNAAKIGTVTVRAELRSHFAESTIFSFLFLLRSRLLLFNPTIFLFKIPSTLTRLIQRNQL